MSKEVEQILDVLAERFGTTVELLWGILLKQAFLEGVFSLMYVGIIVIGTIVIGLLWIHAIKIMKKAVEGNSYDSDLNFYDLNPLFGIPLILGSIANLISLLFLPSLFTKGVGYLVNPEFYIIKYILSTFN